MSGLDEGDVWALAEAVEAVQRAAGAIRYGSILRVGIAHVVLNPDSPFVAANFAAGLDGTPPQAEAALTELESVFAEAGREEGVVVASPTSMPELEVLAAEVGWFAAEEGLVFLLRARSGGKGPGAERGDPSPPRATVRPARDGDLPAVAELLADAAGLPTPAGLLRHLGHRLEDPRCTLLVGEREGTVEGMLSAVTDRGLAVLSEVVVRPDRQRHGTGSALVATALPVLYGRGARQVVTACEAGGTAERFTETVGFEPAYGTTTLVRRVR